MNYYLLLGVPEDADADRIRSAFRALARRYHPDAGKGSSADRFREILSAYETLNDPTRRWRYDRILHERRTPIPQVVEPLRAQAAPEPMLRPKTKVVRTNLMYDPVWPPRLNDLIDELFQSWDEVFFVVWRGGDRI
jgi:curved DNA-binding protein CbpA